MSNFAIVERLSESGVYPEDAQIIKLDDTHFLCAYKSGASGVLETYSTDVAHENITKIDSEGFCSGTMTTVASLISITSTYYVVAYRDGTDCTFTLFSLNENYEVTIITSTEIGFYGNYASMSKIDNHRFAVAYDAGRTDGKVRIMLIDVNYTTITAQIDLWHDYNGTYNSTLIYNDTNLLLAFLDNAGNGVLKLFPMNLSLNTIGSITASGNFNTGTITETSMIWIDEETFLLSYTDSANKGILKTIVVDTDGGIQFHITGTLEFINGGYNTRVIEITETEYIVKYRSSSQTGIFIQITITKDVAPFSHTITKGASVTYETQNTVSGDIVNIDEYSLAVFFNRIDDGTNYLSLSTFANPTLATVTTEAVTDIDIQTATGNGTITGLGYTIPTQHGVCWSTSSSPTISDSKTEEGAVSSTGAFTSSITGLSSKITYYVRAYVTNSVGTSYGDNVEFTTLRENFKVKYSIIATPIEHFVTEYSRGRKIISGEIGKSLSCIGSTSVSDYDNDASVQGYLDKQAYYKEALDGAGNETAISTATSASLVFIKNTGHVFSSSSKLGIKNEDRLLKVTINSGAIVIAALSANETIALKALKSTIAIDASDISIETVDSDGKEASGGEHLAVEFLVTQ